PVEGGLHATPAKPLKLQLTRTTLCLHRADPPVHDLSFANKPLAGTVSRCAVPSGRVEVWRGGVGEIQLLPTLSVAGASLVSPCSVSTPRSSNRTGGLPASGFRTRTHAFAHGKSRVRSSSWMRPSRWCRYSSGKRAVPLLCTLCLARNH